MTNEITNQSGIIRVQITKNGKISYAEIYVDTYLRLIQKHKGMGDTMIQSVLNQFDIYHVLPTYE